MQIDIANHIEKLLFLHDALTIPSFGAFTARSTAAAADYAGGTVAPPSKTLTFNENMTADDGLLVQDISRTHGLSSEEARKALQDFVDNMQDLLNRREIVTLPGIGRLYKNYVHKIQFLPDATNFNATSFGLPPLQFSPIARSREVTDAAVVGAAGSGATTSVRPPAPNEGTSNAVNTVAAAPPPSVVTETASAASQRRGSGVVPMLIIILVLLCGMAGYWAWKQNKNIQKIAEGGSSTEQSDTRPDKGKSNVAPPKPRAEGKEPADKEPSPIARPVEEPAVEQPAETPQQKTKAGSTGKHECILVIATLREQVNADRLIGMLEDAGYQVYFLHKNGFQVGVQFRYNQLSEVQDNIVALQKLTGESQIWIKKK